MDQFFTNNTQSIVASNRILYTPSTFARSSLLHLQEIGELEARRAHTSSRSGLQSYLFFNVVSGQGSLVYEGKEFSLIAGDCVFIDCNNPYSHTTSPDNLWRLKWIHFYGPTMGEVYKKYKERGGRPVFRPESNEEIGSVWSSLMTVARSHDYMRDMLINQHLSSLLTLIMAESWHPEDQDALPPKKQIIKPVKEYLDKNYGEKITLDGLAAQFYINKYYLTKTFKEQYGVSIMAYLLNLRITRAKQLLRFSEKSVEEIGLECGLGAAHYFSQTFKNVEGVPPSKYREQW
jgi:AraC family transcriptional regulator of arabinose operon